MITIVFTLMILSGIAFIISVLLMTPKGGLGFGVGGMSTSNEYGSKKSVESTLKKAALVSIVFFTLTVMVYPYIAKDQLSTGQTQQQIQLNTEEMQQTQKEEQNDIDIKGGDIEEQK